MRALHEDDPEWWDGVELERLRRLYGEDEITIEVWHNDCRQPTATCSIPIDDGNGYQRLFDRAHPLSLALPAAPLPVKEWRRGCELRVAFRGHTLWRVLTDSPKGPDISPVALSLACPMEGEGRWREVVRGEEYYVPGARECNGPNPWDLDGEQCFFEGDNIAAELAVDGVLPPLCVAEAGAESLRPLMVEALALTFSMPEGKPAFLSRRHFFKALHSCVEAGEFRPRGGGS